MGFGSMFHLRLSKQQNKKGVKEKTPNDKTTKRKEEMSMKKKKRFQNSKIQNGTEVHQKTNIILQKIQNGKGERRQTCPQ